MSALPTLSWPARCRKGSALIEYAFVAALIGLVGLAASTTVGNGLSLLLYNTAAHLRGTPPTHAPPIFP